MVKINLKDIDNSLTPEEIQELEEAEKKEPVFDEDSPEMTEEMLAQFKRMDVTSDDYTKWQREHYDSLTEDEIYNDLKSYSATNKFEGKKATTI